MGVQNWEALRMECKWCGSNFGFDGGGIQIDLQQQWIGDFTELGKIEDW